MRVSRYDSTFMGTLAGISSLLRELGEGSLESQLSFCPGVLDKLAIELYQRASHRKARSTNGFASFSMQTA